MSDLAIAGVLFAFLLGLALAAPIWGADSRDGVESDQPARRAAWLHNRTVGHAARPARAARPAGVALAGMLRTAAYRLDAEAGPPCRPDQRLAEAC